MFEKNESSHADDVTRNETKTLVEEREKTQEWCDAIPGDIFNAFTFEIKWIFSQMK